MALTHTDASDVVLLILGASGDLTSRLLLPGLAGLLRSGRVTGLSLIGSSRQDWTDEHWREVVRKSFASADTSGPGSAEADRVARTARYVVAQVDEVSELRRLLDMCQGRRPVIYFALPPAVTEKVCQELTAIHLPEGTRLVLEKPFGNDVASAEALNSLLARLVPEDHTFRVDHFLGRSTILNLIGLRFGNRVVEPLLNSDHVECVELIFDESLALEGRASYYDRAGALVDMIQSHALQVLSLLAMEAPYTLSQKDLRDRKTQLLRAIRLWHHDPVTCSRRARYTAGEINGERIPSYVDEDGVDPALMTESYAEVVLAVDSWRWAGVPIRVRSGKALGETRKEAVITFKQPPWVPPGLGGYDRPDRLRIGFGPDCLRLDLNISAPGDPLELEPVTLRTDFGPGEMPAYGEVLKGVLDGDPTFTVRGDAAVQCWRIVEPVLKAWRANKVPMEEYAAGSDGPQPPSPTPVQGMQPC